MVGICYWGKQMSHFPHPCYTTDYYEVYKIFDIIGLNIKFPEA